MKHLVEAIPELQFVFTNTEHHPHPVAAFERYWAEYKALCTLQPLVAAPADAQALTNANRILALNSSASRIAGHNMLDLVHFFQGADIAADVFRNTAVVPDAVIHDDLADALDFDNPYGAILWTHCLHRYTPRQIGCQLLTTRTREGVGLTHAFDGYQGSICAGEAQWQRCGDMDEIEMHVTGGTPYRHQACDWLYDNGFHFTEGDQDFTLCWTTCNIVGDTTALRFKVVEGTLPFVTPVTDNATLAGALRTTRGELDLRTYHKNGPVKNKGVEVLFSPKNKYYAFGVYDNIKKRSVVIVPDGQHPVAVPVGIISDLAIYVSGKKRNSDSWQSIVNRAKQLLRDTSLSSVQAAEALPHVAAMGFISGLESEVDSLLLIGDKSALAAEHAKLTDFDFSQPWYNRLLRGLPRMSALANRFVRWVAGLNTRWAWLLAFAIWRVPLLRRIILGSFVKGSWLEAIRTFRNVVFRILSQFSRFFTERYKPINVGDDVMVNVCVGERELRDMHEQARVYYDRADLNQCKPGFGNMPIGVFMPNLRPTTYRNCFDNQLAAVVNRGCIDRTDDLLTKPFWRAAWAWEEQYPTVPLSKVHPMDLETWLSRFPPARAADHRRALATETSVEVPTDSEAFVKVENAINWSAETGLILTDPRLIQGKKSMFQILLGPFFVAYSKFVASFWNGEVSRNTPQTFLYASGTDANAVGRWFDRSLTLATELALERNEHLVMIDLDQSRFDATVGLPALDYNLAMYERNGMPTRSALLYDRAMCCKGVTSHGVRYSVVGTRKSGEADTSVGNSALNKCVGSVYGALATTWTSMALLGDDNNTISVSPYPPQVAGAHLVQVCRDAGFNPEAHVVTSRHDMTFCSSRFWPSTAGTILAPKIGRVIAKTFYATRMVTQSEAMAQVRGICLGMVNDVRHVPVLRKLIPRMLTLTSGHKPIMPKKQEVRFHASEAGECCDETWEMVLHLYDLTRDDILDAEAYVEGIPSLPCGLNHWVLDRICSVDCPMKGSEVPAKSELAVPDVVLDIDYDRLRAIDPIGKAARRLWPTASAVDLVDEFIRWERLDMILRWVKRWGLTDLFYNCQFLGFLATKWEEWLAAPILEELGKRCIPWFWTILPVAEFLNEPSVSRLFMFGFHRWCARQTYAAGVAGHMAHNICALAIQFYAFFAKDSDADALRFILALTTAFTTRYLMTGTVFCWDDTFEAFARTGRWWAC